MLLALPGLGLLVRPGSADHFLPCPCDDRAAPTHPSLPSPSPSPATRGHPDLRPPDIPDDSELPEELHLPRLRLVKICTEKFLEELILAKNFRGKTGDF